MSHILLSESTDPPRLQLYPLRFCMLQLSFRRRISRQAARPRQADLAAAAVPPLVSPLFVVRIKVAQMARPPHPTVMKKSVRNDRVNKSHFQRLQVTQAALKRGCYLPPPCLRATTAPAPEEATDKKSPHQSTHANTLLFRRGLHGGWGRGRRR